MLRVWQNTIARPTRDIDLLGRVENTPQAVREIVLHCVAASVRDGLTFSPDVEAEPIMLQGLYPGVRAKVSGELAGARFVLRLDLAVDDVVVPDPEWVEYPTLLGDEAPRILAYQPATAIAEKLQAMVEIGLSNSRIRDYHDIWMLSHAVRIDGRALAAALRATFDNRGTALPGGVPPELTMEYASQPTTERLWAAYRSSMAKTEVSLPAALAEMVDEIAAFVMPVIHAAANEARFEDQWIPGKGWR